ncbi:MAG: adenosylmethionine decarboxylase [Sporomusaceae bacterium]|nr:adenosylmethionine decarboxylase [Sporomusaceae bacterium]
MEIKGIKKLKLYGFNNLTKTLSFNMYDICYAKTPQHRRDYIKYIDEEYNAARLTSILTEVSHIIGANILNIARQDYDPQGASVTMLISEGEVVNKAGLSAEDIIEPDAVVCHLDKSHITVHTYPESHPDEGISTFRADIDVSTCGQISPLKALNYLLKTFRPDIAAVDYRVRGFTRDVNGKKFFIDHKINSIQNYIASTQRDLYQMIDVNVYQENIFHTKMLLREFDLNNYLFGTPKKELLSSEKKKIKQRLKKEMAEIFYGKNIPKVTKKNNPDIETDNGGN